MGQQHPHERVPDPWDAEWIKGYNGNRVFVAVARALQRKEKQNVRMGGDDDRGGGVFGGETGGESWRETPGGKGGRRRERGGKGEGTSGSGERGEGGKARTPERSGEGKVACGLHENTQPVTPLFPVPETPSRATVSAPPLTPVPAALGVP